MNFLSFEGKKTILDYLYEGSNLGLYLVEKEKLIMPRKAEKAKANSVSAMTEAVDRLQTKIESPIPLNKAETAVFDSIIEALPTTAWQVFRIRLAANLAKLTLYCESVMQTLQEEGPTIENARGTLVANPLQSALQQNLSSIQAMTRTLGISASQRGVSETSTAPARAAEDKAKGIIEKASKSDLLG